MRPLAGRFLTREGGVRCGHGPPIERLHTVSEDEIATVRKTKIPECTGGAR
jgi:hypothetical protein